MTLRAAPALTIALLVLPIGAGLLGTLLPAFGWLPAIGGQALSLDPWRSLFEAPGLGTAIRLSVSTGLAATLLSLALVLGFCAAAHDTRGFRRMQAALAPILATPHAALAIGFAFLIAPSGWILRLFSPWATGWDRPPDLVTVQDPLGIALVLGLCLKEVPYLLLMTLATLAQVRAAPALAVARTLGYGPVMAWLKVVAPQLWPQLRLPVYAVLAFSLSVVDVALVLGPSNPPTLAVMVVRWFADRDIALWFPAAAGALLQAGIVAGAIALAFAIERLARPIGRRWIFAGGRGGEGAWLARGASVLLALILAASLLAILALAIWSFAGIWRFPDALPQAWSLATWRAQGQALAAPAAATLGLASASTLLALVLVLLCLEAESRFALAPGRGATLILYLPLLLPQIAFLFGLQVVLVRLRLDGMALAVVWAHLLFVLPYVYLSLADPWRALDPRMLRAAVALGAGPWRCFLAVKLPLLLRPVLAAAAVGFAVSVSLYLPTLFAGAGRIATLTTEAITLAAGSDRRILGAYALLQAVLPLLVYSVAIAVPAWHHRNRAGMQVR